MATTRIFLLVIMIATYSDYYYVYSLGINYGQLGNNLLPPQDVITLLKSLRVTKSRIYDTNPQVLTAFANSNIELIVTVENSMLPMLIDREQALQWVNTHIKPYFPATKISGIAVGNEIISDDTGDATLMANIVPAMISIQNALDQLGLASYIHVSTASSLAVLSESYPPSAGSFKPEVYDIMSQLLSFLNTTKSPFWINAYPYFAYKDNSNSIPLDYVLFNPNSGMVDPYTKLHYDNMLYAQVDAVIFALARMGYGGIEVRVSETGWPSKGEENEVGANIQNAGVYNSNLLRRQFEGEGTPLRPNLRLEVFLFALFNENEKPGPTSERNYGLFQPDGTMVYNVGITSSSPGGGNSPASGGNSPASGGNSPASGGNSPTTTASISLTSSSNSKASTLKGLQSYMQWMIVSLVAVQVCMKRHL